jgi:WD40 repeat protein
MVLTGDGRALAISARKNNVISLWDTATGTNFLRLPPRAGVVTDLAFSPDGRMLAVAGDDTTVQLRDTRSGELRATLAGHETAVASIAFSPDGRTLVTANATAIKLWHIPTRREVGTLTGAYYLAFSPDGTRLLLAHWDGVARLLRAPYPKEEPPPP